MFSSYKRFIEEYVTLNFLKWKIIKSKLTTRHYKKGDIIHNIGDIPSHLMFIYSGLARSYAINENGSDHTWMLHFNDKNSHILNLFVVDYDAFIHQRESRLEIEAVEDCDLISVEYNDIEFLYNNTKKGDRFGRLMAQGAYGFLHKVPQYHIATYLGITPQHLSRLKKEYKH